MVSKVRCLVPYMTWWALLLFMLSAGGVSHCVGRIGRGCSWGVVTAFLLFCSYRIPRTFGFWNALLIEVFQSIRSEGAAEKPFSETRTQASKASSDLGLVHHQSRDKRGSRGPSRCQEVKHIY